MIGKYANPDITKLYGQHLEDLVKTELEKQGFKIIKTHAKKFKNKEYKKSNHDLDFIAEHQSSKLTIGVEVKNTISMLDKKEVEAKLDMCSFFKITPVFAVRWLQPYAKLIRDNGGFLWTFNKQLYPTQFKLLTAKLNKQLHLPVETANQLPAESTQLFHKWVKKQITIA